MLRNKTRSLRKKARHWFRKAFNPGALFAYWHVNDLNWGDGINPILIQHLSRKKTIFSDNPFAEKQMVVGSILHLADKYTVVWGAGFIAAGLKTKDTPRAIHAVRGPLTRRQLLENGIEAPEVYGDPALLLPFFFNPEVPKRYEVGIIPHYVDKYHPWLKQISRDPKVLLIDVQGDHRAFVESVKSCNFVISSSLHGVICADAYDVPSMWVEFSGLVVGAGFKFRDYFESVQRESQPPVSITEGTSLSRALAHHKDYKIKIDKSLLFHACPFLAPEVKELWEKQSHF